LIAIISFYYYLFTALNDIINQTNDQIDSVTKLQTANPKYNYSDSIDSIVKTTQSNVSILDSVGGTVYILLFLIPAVPLSIIIKLLLEHARKEFQLYYAKGCFNIVSKEDTHALNKAKYFKTGLICMTNF
jgi:hypothetical protein